MASIDSVIRKEVSRVAKRERSKAEAPLIKELSSLRAQNQELIQALTQLRNALVSLPSAPKRAERSRGARRAGGAAKIAGGKSLDPKSIKALRKTTGLSQTKFGKLVGVSLPTVVNWEKGRTVPNPVAMKKLLSLGASSGEKLEAMGGGTKPAKAKRGRKPGRKPGRPAKRRRRGARKAAAPKPAAPKPTARKRGRRPGRPRRK